MIGRAVHVMRAERGWSRADLATHTGLSYPFIAEIEKGTKMPSRKSLEKLAWAFDVRPSAILARAEDIERRFGVAVTA